MLHRHGERGVSLVEALLAFVVLSIGLLGMARLQTILQRNADSARHRTEAVRLAQEDMEGLRAFAAVDAMPEVRSYADVVPNVRLTSEAGPSRYRINRSVGVSDSAGLKTVTVTANWSDRAGQEHRVLLQSAIASTPPALSGALLMQSRLAASHSVHGRRSHIPVHAQDRGDGTSVLRSPEGHIAWVFNNASGRIIGHCTGALTQRASADANDDGAPCTPVNAVLLTGWVRFSLQAPANALRPDDRPLPVSIALALTESVSDPVCFTELREGAVAYHCAIVPVSGGWSGRSSLVPQGWTIGTAADQYKVCRYSVDHDGSGAIDRHAEHPEHYSHVDGQLMQQNFLVIRGDQACPQGTGPTTVQHQP